MKAVECQQEECATLLLERGADPNVVDVCGNTALHYTVLYQNVSLAAKLLSYDANIEARNKDDLTPLLFGISEGKQQIVEFLVKKEADIHAVDNMKRTALMLAVNSECMDVVRLLLQRGADVFSRDLFGWTAEEYAAMSGFKIICKLISEYKEKRPKTPPEKSKPVDKSSEEDCLSRLSSKPRVGSRLTSDDEVLDFETKVEEEKKHRSSEVEASDNVCHAAAQSRWIQQKKSGGNHKQEFPAMQNEGSDREASINMQHLGTSFSVSYEAGLVVMSSLSSDPGVPRKEIEEKNIGNWTQEECVIAPIFGKTDSLTGGLLHVNDDSISRKVDRDDGRPARKAAYEKKKHVPKSNLARLTEALQQFKRNKCGIVRPGSTTFSEDKNSDREIGDVVETFPKTSPGVQGFSHPAFPRPEPLPEPLRTPAGLGLAKEGATKPELVEKESDADIIERAPQKQANHDHLTSVDRAYKNNRSDMMSAVGLGGEKDIESPWDSEVEKEKKQKSSEVEVSDSVCDAGAQNRWIQQRKSGGNHKQEFPAMQIEGSDREASINMQHSDPGVPRKEIEEKNNGNWTQEECVIAPIFGKTDSLTGGLLHVNDDTILRKVGREDGRPARKTAYEKKKVSDSGRKAKVLLCKNHRQDETAMPRLERDTVKNQNQEKEKKSFEDIETLKGENDYPQKAIKLNKEVLTITTFQHTGQFNVPVAENTVLNSELENAKQSTQSLETEVESYHSRLAAAMHDHHPGQTSQRDLELASQKAKDKRLRLQDQTKFDMAKLKSDNEMLSQQLSKVKNKFNKLKIKLHQTRDDLREKTLMLERVQTDLCQAECQKQDIEHMYQSEQGKVNEYLGKQESLEERLSQLQCENMLLRQQLDDARNRADSKEKTVISILDQVHQIVRKLHAESEKRDLMLEERNKELVNEHDHLKERLCQCENEKAEREAVVRHRQQELYDSVKKQSALEASLDVMSRHPAKLEAEARDLKSKFPQPPSQIDHLPTELETARSQCLHLDAKNQILQQELLSMKGRQRKCEKREKENRKLEQEIQAASQENLQQFQEEHIASVRSPMELRIKDLESELSKMKTSQDSDKAELEKYKKLYLEELKVRKRLESKLDKTLERLAEMSTKCEVEKQQNRSVLSTPSRRPVLEPPCSGNFRNTVMFNSNLCPRANVEFSSSDPLPSNHTMVTHLLETPRKLMESIIRELEEGAAECEYEFSRFSSLLARGGSNLD